MTPPARPTCHLSLLPIAPTQNASAEGEQPAPSQLTPVVDDAMDEAIGTGQTEIAEQPAPVASEPVVTVADESSEVEKTSEIVASAKDDAVSGAPADVSFILRVDVYVWNFCLLRSASRLEELWDILRWLL